MNHHWYGKVRACKFQPADMRVLVRVLAKTPVVHHFVNKGKWMAGDGAHTGEWDDIRVSLLDAQTSWVDLFVCR